MSSFSNREGVLITRNLIEAMIANRQYLSDIDGLIGDGDHGINMSKGFSKARAQIDLEQATMSESLRALGSILLNEIGGSMGPLYGAFFLALARASAKAETIDAPLLAQMLGGALIKVREIGEAAVGDKTLIDCLEPAVNAFAEAVADGAAFCAALERLKAAAQQGRDSTIDLVARKGRASRLGERSRGVLDPGATSCCLILCTMADSIGQLLGAAQAEPALG